MERRGGALVAAGGAKLGPYDLLVGADGARSTMRRFLGVRARIHEHRWGALWGVFPDREGAFDGRLDLPPGLALGLARRDARAAG